MNKMFAILFSLLISGSALAEGCKINLVLTDAHQFELFSSKDGKKISSSHKVERLQKSVQLENVSAQIGLTVIQQKVNQEVESFSSAYKIQFDKTSSTEIQRRKAQERAEFVYGFLCLSNGNGPVYLYVADTPGQRDTYRTSVNSHLSVVDAGSVYYYDENTKRSVSLRELGSRPLSQNPKQDILRR